jgi:hypothetical protein
MVADRSDGPRIPRWIRALGWIGAWALVVAASRFLPLWGAIGLAVAVFAAQLLLAPGRAACHLPDAARDPVTDDTPRVP